MTDRITIHSVAGYCNEKTLWKLLVDLTAEKKEDCSEEWKVPMPERIVVDGDDFIIDSNEPKEVAVEFYPPEGIDNYDEAGYVWSLGALVCYASSGHYIFGGRGGAYQGSNPNVELPTLRKEHSSLSPLIKKCLCYSPSQRISLNELHAQAVLGFESINHMGRVKREDEHNDSSTSPEDSDFTWPEKMG